MTTAINHGRQWLLVAEQQFDFSDLDVAPSALTITLPRGAAVVRAGIFVETVFGAGAAMAVGITGTTDLYVSALDLHAVAYTAFSTGLAVKTSGETIILTPDTEAIAATAGTGRLVIEYIIEERANEVQP